MPEVRRILTVKQTGTLHRMMATGMQIIRTFYPNVQIIPYNNFLAVRHDMTIWFMDYHEDKMDIYFCFTDPNDEMGNVLINAFRSYL
ncbi:unnamed protein product [Hymenolepis diminuta]|uniref:Uncharacterized protein n=1 Tax=Hymenolepis diminuta TaxID=6216 RepID=A0A564Z8K9_HYMDI|nr:unnamed protein product [Hymenolepis diminuta]